MKVFSATSLRIARSLVVLGAILAGAYALVLAGRLQLGLGLAFPGAGFWPSVWDDGGDLCFGLPGWITFLVGAILSHILFALAVIWWFGAGNVMAPPVVWLASALVAHVFAPGVSRIPPDWLIATPFALWALLVTPLLLPRIGRRPKPIPARPGPMGEALDPELARQAQFALTRALQPLDAFNGFQFVDQFQTAAPRYQLAQAGYALALMNARLPAFRGYLAQSQRNLILKQTDHRIWSYWQLENLWGNFDRNPDPVARDNIMYVGFLAAQIALYSRATGDMRFHTEDALSLRMPDGRVYPNDQVMLTAALHRGWDASPFTLMACEPNWIYPLCNAIGACAARADTPDEWTARSESFRRALSREFRGMSGHIVPFRSSLLGFAAPPIGGAVVDAYPVTFWNPIYPDLAAELWALARRGAIRDGAVNLRRFWKVDTGDYRLSRAASLAGFACAAAEMGDAEARDLALSALEVECPAEGPQWHRPEASVFAHMTELMARLNPGGGLATMFAADPPEDGPVLDLRDTRVSVLAARGEAGALHITLKGDGPADVPVTGFRPGARLICGNASANADLEGTARFALTLSGTRSFTIAEVP